MDAFGPRDSFFSGMFGTRMFNVALFAVLGFLLSMGDVLYMIAWYMHRLQLLIH